VVLYAVNQQAKTVLALLRRLVGLRQGNRLLSNAVFQLFVDDSRAVFEILPLCEVLNVSFGLFRDLRLVKRVDFLEVLGGASVVTFAVELDCASHRISPTKN